MTKNQIDQFEMVLAVENHFNDNPTLWTGNAPIAASKTLLSTKIVGISEQLAIQLINTTGVTQTKEGTRKKLEIQAFIISAAMSGYATVVGNTDLYNRVHYTETALGDFRGAELIGICTNLSQDANTEIANIATYGILPATLTTYNTMITAFGAVLKNPEEAIAKRKAATEKLAVLIPDVLDMLATRMDNLIVALTATQPAFVDI